jgi:hypothetical protein
MDMTKSIEAVRWSFTMPMLAVALATIGCAGSAAQAPAPAAQPVATAPAPAGEPAPAAPPAATAGADPADWNAPPTNGSPGMDVPKPSGNNLIANADFGDGKSLPWTNSFTVPANGRTFVSKDKEYCLDMTNKGANPWDAQVRHREMTIQKGHTYSVSYKAHATQPTRMKIKVGMSGPPYKEYWADTVDLTSHPITAPSWPSTWPATWSARRRFR